MPESLIDGIRKARKSRSRLTFEMISYILLGLLTGLLTPWPLKLMIDEVLRERVIFHLVLDEHRQIEAIFSLGFLYFFLIWCRGYFNHKRHVLLTKWADETSEQLRLSLFERVLHIPFPTVMDYPADDLRARLSEDVDRVRDCFVEVFGTALAETVTLVGAFLILFWVDGIYATFSLLVLLALGFLYRYFPNLIGEKNKSVRAQEAKRTSVVSAALQERTLIKSWGQESAEVAKLQNAAGNFAEGNLEKALLEGKFIFAVEKITAFVQALTLSYGAWRVSRGTLSVGDLVLFLQYLMLMHAPIGRLSAFLVTYHRGLVGWNRIQETLQLGKESGSGERITQTVGPAFAGLTLEFKDVSFAYNEGPTLFEKLNFAVKPNQVLALTGASGTGKSTILKLFLRFFEPLSGEILINGKSLSLFGVESLRSQMAYVDQEPHLIASSVRENLCYGTGKVSEERLQELCRLFKIDLFVAELKDGYNSQVLDSGVNFSAGQRQRIALVRALVSDRPIILMDEPTSALDNEFERDLVEKLPKMLGGKTVVLVTHRTLPLKIASQIVTLSGRPSERFEMS